MTKPDFIRKLANELGISGGTLTTSTELTSLAAWDSMGRMAVLALIDAELSIEIPAGSLQKCRNVGDLLSLVEGKLSDG